VCTVTWNSLQSVSIGTSFRLVTIASYTRRDKPGGASCTAEAGAYLFVLSRRVFTPLWNAYVRAGGCATSTFEDLIAGAFIVGRIRRINFDDASAGWRKVCKRSRAITRFAIKFAEVVVLALVTSRKQP